MPLPRRPQVGVVSVPPRPAAVPGRRPRHLGQPLGTATPPTGPGAADRAPCTGRHRLDAAPGRTRAARRRARPRTQARSRPPPRRTPRTRTAASASPARAAPTRRIRHGSRAARSSICGEMSHPATRSPAAGEGPGELPGAAPQVEDPVPGLRVPADGGGQAGQPADQRSVRSVLRRPGRRLGVEKAQDFRAWPSGSAVSAPAGGGRRSAS